MKNCAGKPENIKNGPVFSEKKPILQKNPKNQKFPQKTIFPYKKCKKYIKKWPKSVFSEKMLKKTNFAKKPKKPEISANP